MEMASSPRTVEEIFKDYSSRRAGVVRALTYGTRILHNKRNLCLYGHTNESWEVTLPAEEVPPELPEPAIGINFARDGMNKRDWLSLVAVRTDCWLLAVSFYFGACLNRNERSRSSDGQVRSNPKLADESYEEDEDEHNKTLCGSCGSGRNYNAYEFWIGCDICERWFHGKCVKTRPAKA